MNNIPRAPEDPCKLEVDHPAARKLPHQTFAVVRGRSRELYQRTTDLKFQFLETMQNLVLSNGTHDPNHPYSMSTSLQFPAKNRYSNVKPFDKNRVSVVTGDGSDYINASWIQTPNDGPLFIAAQGPLDTTILAFWKMVFDYKVETIVMLTKTEDSNRSTCAKYWPDPNYKIDHGPISIACVSEVAPIRGVSIREFDVYYLNSQPLRVKQCQFTEWPDHGVPEIGPIDEFIHFVSEIVRLNPFRSPIVVHCSAGCGRTGTFCVLYTIYGMLWSEFRDKSDIIFNLVNYFREQRARMVETSKQFNFCYDMLYYKLGYRQ